MKYTKNLCVVCALGSEFMACELYHSEIVYKNRHIRDFGRLVTLLVSFRKSSLDTSDGESFRLVPTLWGHQKHLGSLLKMPTHGPHHRPTESESAV